MALLLRLSLAGSLLAAVLFLLKPVLRGRVSRAAAYYLWLLVLLRLCLPVGLTLSLPEVPASVPVASSTVTPANQAVSPPAQGNPTPAPEPVQKGDSLPTLLVALWAVGAVGVGGWYVVGYLRVRRTIDQSALPAGEAARTVLLSLEPRGRVQLVESPAVDSPLLLGVLQPTIVLPVGLTDPARLRDILAHELTHARRHDLLFKWFAAFAASVHWFNPLLPFVRREIGRACELACDEAVVRSLAPPARKQYGETLLLLAAKAPMGALPLAVTLCEEKQSLEERLVSIVKIHRRTPAALLLTVALALALGGCALFSGAAVAEIEQFQNPNTGAVLRLGMTRQEAEALLGERRQVQETVQFLKSENGAGTPAQYDNYGTGEDSITLLYLDDTVYGILVDANYTLYENGTPSGPFPWVTSKGITCGSSLEAVQAQYEGETVVDENLGSWFGYDDSVPITLVTVTEKDWSLTFCLTEEDGVFEILFGSGELMSVEELDAVFPSSAAVDDPGQSP